MTQVTLTNHHDKEDTGTKTTATFVPTHTCEGITAQVTVLDLRNFTVTYSLEDSDPVTVSLVTFKSIFRRIAP